MLNEEEIIEKYHHFKIKTADGIELDLIETKYYKELLDLYKQEKEKNKELEKQINFNKKTVETAQTQILEYSQGYKDGLNKETTATAIVARELELNFIRQEIKHKYISKDKIREKIEELEKELKEFQELDFISEAAKRHQQIQVLNNLLEDK